MVTFFFECREQREKVMDIRKTDQYLASIGLYRKRMARDTSCVFRAVSEQLYFSQNYHRRIQKECVKFIRANRCKFEPYIKGSFRVYLHRLKDAKENTGLLEINALSSLYRRHFVIYSVAGNLPMEIAEEENLPKILLCHISNGYYDLVYPQSYRENAGICQSLLYELLYTHVLGVEEEELQVALEEFSGESQQHRNSKSLCSGYDAPEERTQREEWELNGQDCLEVKAKAAAEDQKAAEGSGKLALPYKVLRALNPELYHNVEFDVWQDRWEELQKTDYIMFAGRRYCLGEKCQVLLDPKGKYYNAFIQNLRPRTTAVTLFIEELGEAHWAPLTSLKPVNPVPAWNITPSRKGNSYNHPEKLDPELHGQRQFSTKVSSSCPQPGLPPLEPRLELQKTDYIMFAGRRYCLGEKCQVLFDPKGKYYNAFIQDLKPCTTAVTVFIVELGEKHCVPLTRLKPVNPVPAWKITPSRKGNSYNHPEKLDPELCGRQQFSKKVSSSCSQPGLPPLEPRLGNIHPKQSPGVHGPAPPPADAGFQSPSVYAATAEYASNLVDVNSSVISSSQPINWAPAAIFTSNFSPSSTGRTQTHPNLLQSNSILTPGQPPPQNVLGRPDYNVLQYYYNPWVLHSGWLSMATDQMYQRTAPRADHTVPQAYPEPVRLCLQGDPCSNVPGFVNELKNVVAMAPPPSYSYEPNGSDLLRDYNVLQYYYNLGVLHSGYQRTAPRADHTVPQAYPEPVCLCLQGDPCSNGTPLVMKPPLRLDPGTVFYPMVQEQYGQPPLTYGPYVPMPSTTYLTQ